MTNKISDEESCEQIAKFMDWRSLAAPKQPAYNPNYNKPEKGVQPAWSKVDDILYSKSVNNANKEVYS